MLEALEGFYTIKLKILHFIPSMGGGGAERQLCYIAEKMPLKGIDVHVAYFNEGPNSKRLYNSDAVVHKLSCRSNYDPMIIYNIVKTIRNINPHIIQTWIPQTDILAGLSSILTKTPLILSERNSSLAYKGGWKDNLRIVFGKRADAIIANSKEGINYWVEKVKRPVLKVIPNGIPFDEILQTPKISLSSMQIDESNEIIIFAGSYYDRQKNLFNLLKALQIVLHERCKAVAFFFGDGPQKKALINVKDKYEVRDRIKIMDYTGELWNWFKVANVFVSVSNYEGNPNTVLEAVASKCPVVISDIPEHREILDEDSSYFVPVSDIKAIKNGILKALSEPDEAKRKAENAYNKIKTWSTEAVADKYIEFYHKLLNQKGF